MGDTYRSARLLVRGPPATERFHQKSTVGGRLKGEIDRRRSIEGEIDRRRSIEREKGRKKRKNKKKKEKKRKNTYRLRAVLACVPSPPAGRGRSFSRAGRKTEETKIKEAVATERVLNVMFMYVRVFRVLFILCTASSGLAGQNNAQIVQQTGVVQGDGDLRNFQREECKEESPYRPVRTGPTADRYADRSLSGSTAKIDHRRLIKGEIDHRRLIGEEKGKKKKKKKKKYIARAPSLPTGRPCTLVACGSPANRRRPRVAREPSLPLGRPQALAARGERDQGNVAMDSSVMGMAASWYHRGETSVETSIPCSHEGRALVVNGAKNMENVKANPSTKTRLKGKGQRTS
ncbi:hypothetical protein GW17_00019606 [Ensete ventricosum]|nr:hypothetical protein GW17_00019606 [Ensete ventricosum]